MIVGIGEEDVYHEAGHAAMFCYYNIPIQYVSVRPDLANGYAGMVVVAADEPSNGRAELEDWMRCAAAGDAARSHILRRDIPETDDLIAVFIRALTDITENPDRRGHSDMRNFTRLGHRRDRELSQADASQAGPAGWAPIWLDAETLVRGDLWPAVQAVAERLWEMVVANDGKDLADLPDLDGEEAAAIVSEAMSRNH
jgi:hypothetical protein